MTARSKRCPRIVERPRPAFRSPLDLLDEPLVDEPFFPSSAYAHGLALLRWRIR